MPEPAAETDFDWGPLGEEWQRAFRWVEATIGGRLVAAHRQARWRPAWFLEVERDGERLPLYWRGDRGLEGINSVYNVEYEAKFFPILESHGIPVPHLHGICRDPLGLLVDQMPGRCNLGTAGTEEERRSVLEHYMELLARMHAIDPREFEAVGMARPRSPRDIALGDFDLWVSEFHKAKRRPEPLLEFLIGWCRRNAPAHGQEATLVLSDSGQFLFDAGRVSAVLDLELAFLGDPSADLAALRTRTFAEPLGDLEHGFRHYEKVSGRSLDLQAIRFHTARFNLYTPLTTAHLLADPPPELDWALYQSWHIAWARAALEGAAEMTGLELSDIDPPTPVVTPRTVPSAALVRTLNAAGASENSFQRYERKRALRSAQALASADGVALELDAQERAEVAEVLGHRPASWQRADAELEAVVLDAEPARDAELLRYFHRRIQREHELHRAAMWELEDQVMRPM